MNLKSSTFWILITLIIVISIALFNYFNSSNDLLVGSADTISRSNEYHVMRKGG